MSIKLDRSIILCGFMYSGKSTVGRILSDKLDVPFVDTDDMIVLRCGMTISDIFRIHGESYFRDAEHEVAKQVIQLPPSVISTGGGMMTFERNGILLYENCDTILLMRDIEPIMHIMIKDRSRPMIYGKSADEIRKLYSDRVSSYKKYTRYKVDNINPISCADKIIDLIGAKIC